MTIKAYIVEDEVNSRKALENMLAFYCKNIDVIGHSDNITDAQKVIEDEKPDLLLLDVRLPDGSGFDLLKKLKFKGFKVVFITAYDEYALKAIKLSAIDYLLKPVKPSELKKAIEKVNSAMENEERLSLQMETYMSNMQDSNQNKKIILNTSDKIHVIEIENLIRCEASENYSAIFVEDHDKIIISKTLKEFEELLSVYGFFRCHQSHLINLNYVDSYDKKGSGNILLNTGEKIPLSVRA